MHTNMNSNILVYQKYIVTSIKVGLATFNFFLSLVRLYTSADRPKSARYL